MSQGSSLIQPTPTQAQQDQKEAVPLHVPISATRPATSSSLKENPSSSCHTWPVQTEKGTSGCADDTPRQNPLTCDSLGIYDIGSCFCHSRAHDVIAHSVHAARAQSSLLLAGSKGLDAQIHLHRTQTHPETPRRTQNALLAPQLHFLGKL